MKKLFAIVLSVMIIMNTYGIVMAAENEAVSVTETNPEIKEAKEVLDLLAGKEVFSGDKITRAAFVSAMVDFMGIEKKVPENCFFSDVKSFEETAPYIYAAYDSGWISKDESFEPNRDITPNEALKIVIRMLNYDIVAQDKGGYPSGDIYVAKSLNILDGVDISAEVLSVNSAYMLLYNAGKTETFEQIAYGDEEKYTDAGKTLFELAYDIYILEGTITRTPYNTLSGDECIGVGDSAEVDGVLYKTTAVNWDMLGVYGRAYIVKNDGRGNNEIVYFRDLSERRKVSLDDIDNKEESLLYYWNENETKLHSLKLATNIQVIFNGRKVTEGIEELFELNAGEADFVDNDENGTYDVVFLNNYDYSLVLGYDSVTETLRDSYSSSRTVLLEQKAVIIKDETGAELDPLDIRMYDIFRMIRSKDDNFIQLQRLDMAVSGIVNKISLSEKKMTIDGTEYILSDYFIENFADVIAVPSEGTFNIDGNIIVSAATSGAEMRYGYVVGCVWSGIFESSLLMRIFTQVGKFEEYELRDKVILDGVKNSKPEAVYNSLMVGGVFKPQLIKFSIAGDGKVRTVDTATTQIPEKPGIYKDITNSLTHYDKMPMDLRYVGSAQAMGARYGVSSSVLFCIPQDIKDEDNYMVRGIDFFRHDNIYPLQVYDMDEYGTAGALIYTGTSSYSVHPDDAAMLIKEIITTTNKDGELIYQIYGWRGGAFVNIMLDDEIEIKKQSTEGAPVKSTHSILSSGDIIAYAEDSELNIKAINVIYDAREGVMTNNVSTFNNDMRAAPMYYEGMVYDANSNFAIISIAKNANGYDFSAENLRYIKISGNNMASYNTKTSEIRPITVDGIKTYKNDGDEAHIGVFHLSNFSLKTAVFYENVEARK